MNLTEAHIGIFNLVVFDGNKMIYDARFDKLSFPEKRYVLSHVDYTIFQNEGRKEFSQMLCRAG